jgi:hypothetical protein
MLKFGTVHNLSFNWIAITLKLLGKNIFTRLESRKRYAVQWKTNLKLFANTFSESEKDKEDKIHLHRPLQ